MYLISFSLRLSNAVGSTKRNADCIVYISFILYFEITFFSLKSISDLGNNLCERNEKDPRAEFSGLHHSRKLTK